MLTPDKLDYMLDSLKVQRELEDGIIRDIARRIAKTGYVTETADWQAERARQAGLLREDVIKRVAAESGRSEKIIREIFKQSKYLIFDSSDSPTKGMDHIWNAALKKTCTEARNLTKTIAITSQKTFIEAADLAHMEIMSGAFTYDQAITNAVKKAAKDGAMVRYPSGKRTSVEAAVRRAVLSGVNQTSGKLCEMRCDELDCDLVETSAHYGARPTHAEWQGGVYSRSGKHPEYESLVDATGYGTGAGLMGWNCNHSMAPFFEGLSKRNYTDEQLRDMREHTVTYNGKEITDYEASQIQRGMERKIRQSRNLLTALDEQGKVTASLEQKNAFAAESVRLKAREGKLRDFCKQTGRRTDAVRTRTASWNRSTSQKAVWANKKTVANRENRGIIKERTKGMYRKAKNRPEPMPKSQLNRIVKSFKRRGGMIIMSDEVTAYLAQQGAEGVTYNENTILLTQKPGRAAVFEELMHSAQYRDGKNDGSLRSRLICEIEAQKKLIKNKDIYKLTTQEVEQTRKALRYYERELEKLERGGIVIWH